MISGDPPGTTRGHGPGDPSRPAPGSGRAETEAAEEARRKREEAELQQAPGPGSTGAGDATGCATIGAAGWVCQLGSDGNQLGGVEPFAQLTQG